MPNVACSGKEYQRVGLLGSVLMCNSISFWCNDAHTSLLLQALIPNDPRLFQCWNTSYISCVFTDPAVDGCVYVNIPTFMLYKLIWSVGLFVEIIPCLFNNLTTDVLSFIISIGLHYSNKCFVLMLCLLTVFNNMALHIHDIITVCINTISIMSLQWPYLALSAWCVGVHMHASSIYFH